MHFSLLIAIGMAVGLLIGLTGMGSGTLLTPLLILVAGMSPATAVGTSLVFSLATKLYASWNFHRRGFLEMQIVRDLSIGGLPGVLFGVFVIRHLQLRRPELMNVFLLRAIGLVLIAVALIMILRLLPVALRPATVDRSLPFSSRQRRLLIVLIGFSVGASVAVTSIGSGTALIPAMVLFYRLDSGRLVGTSIFVGTILSGVGAISHAGLGNVDWNAAVALLGGSIPAVWLSSHLHTRLPRQIPEGIMAAALMAMGVHFMSV
ncbi:MAG TPA: sulfite exporter TauE/SafE family protein [Candidatus Acidoferrales bacterium]